MDYKNIIKTEGWGAGYHIGVKIDLAYIRDITEEEEWEIWKAVEGIKKMLTRNTDLADPKQIAQRAEEKTKILQCFDGGDFYVKEVQNEYCTNCVNPWFVVTTRKGPIKIGWRKRVINIDWSESDVRLDGRNIFAQEDTTTFERGVHAWGYEKAKEYIKKLLS